MKRMVAKLAGVLTLVTAVSVPMVAHAQAPAAPRTGAAPTVTTRIRVVNLGYIIKNYKRMETLRTEHKGLFERYDQEIKETKKKSDEWTENLKKFSEKYTAEQREQVEKEIKRLQRLMTDKSEEARKALAKKEGELITLVYKEIEEAVQKHAETQGFEMVMHFNDAIEPAERDQAANVARKMSAGACMPFYVAPGMDISADVVDYLNKKYAGSAAAPGTTTGSSN